MTVGYRLISDETISKAIEAFRAWGFKVSFYFPRERLGIPPVLKVYLKEEY